MKQHRILIMLVITLMTAQLYSQGGWNYVSNSGTTFNLHGMSFPPGQSTVGFACGMEFDYISDGVIVKTTDGGDNWTQIWPVSGTIDGLKSIWFTNDTVGFACGWNNSFIKTTDGGTSWTDVTGPTNVNRYIDIVFNDEGNGALACFPVNPTIHPAVFITSDGGDTWTPANNIATPDLEGICYASPDTLFAVGTTSTVYISIDGGLNWSVKSTLNDILYSVSFSDPNFGVVGGQEYMYSTTDGGDTWTSELVLYESYYATKAFDDGTAFIGGTVEDIYTTSDFGNTWTLDNDGTGVSTLYRIRYAANGSGHACGSMGRIMSKEPLLSADFTSDQDTACMAGSILFTDLSGGNPVSWSWTFEGGSPATSSAQNPSVSYNTPGTFDVSLVISDGTNTDTITKLDYINAILIPGQPNTPVGADSVCAGLDTDYTTNIVQYASSYEWVVDPAAAGSMSGNDTIASFLSSSTYSGPYSIKVRAINICGNGSWSGDFQGTLLASPQPFFMTGDGSYCEGSQGTELGLDGSETGFNYELYLDNIPTGNIVAGTGAAITFGHVTDEGFYIAVGYNEGCDEDMYGQVYVNMINVPGQAGSPVGMETVCNDTSTVYTSSGASYADTLIWILTPPEAGFMSPISNEVSILWDNSFSGIAELSVYGENDCGFGDTSDILEITVHASPTPEISGLQMVCEDDEAVYSTTDNPGSTYEWDVDGGTITNGAGTHEITILWGEPGMGYITISENNGICEATSDIFEVTIDECTGLDEPMSPQIKIYPNPARDVVNIVLEGKIKLLEVFSYTGAKVIVEQINNSNYSINTSGLNPGVYILRIVSDQGISTKRFIVI